MISSDTSPSLLRGQQVAAISSRSRDALINNGIVGQQHQINSVALSGAQSSHTTMQPRSTSQTGNNSHHNSVGWSGAQRPKRPVGAQTLRSNIAGHFGLQHKRFSNAGSSANHQTEAAHQARPADTSSYMKDRERRNFQSSAANKPQGYAVSNVISPTSVTQLTTMEEGRQTPTAWEQRAESLANVSN